jgi:hypothetical protein
MRGGQYAEDKEDKGGGFQPRTALSVQHSRLPPDRKLFHRLPDLGDRLGFEARQTGRRKRTGE